MNRPFSHALLPDGAAYFLASLDQAHAVAEPFNYWLLGDVLPRRLIGELAALPFAPPTGAHFDGRRESNNATRVYFNPAAQAKFAVCRQAADIFAHPTVIGALARTTGADLSAGRLRMEYCQDVDGFWLEPHLDISVKLLTFLIYLSDDPNLRDAGTDIYDASPEHRRVASAPYAPNSGLIFVPGANTWHGFSRRPIHGLRKSLIINYVASDWRATDELA